MQPANLPQVETKPAPIQTASTPTLAEEVAAGDRLTLAQLARKLKNPATGKSLAIPTVYRWATKGFPDGQGGRVYLKTVRFGRMIYSSWGSYRRFVAALPSCAPVAATTPTPAASGDDAAAAALRDRWKI